MILTALIKQKLGTFLPLPSPTPQIYPVLSQTSSAYRNAARKMDYTGKNPHRFCVSASTARAVPRHRTGKWRKT